MDIRTEPRRYRRWSALGWFIALWASSLLAVGTVAIGIRFLLACAYGR